MRAHAGRIAIVVHDSGPGIGAADIGKIFDPFFSTKERGTGLGLALVQQIVVDHGGQIEVASPPGAGTTFTLTLPVGEGDRQRVSAPPAPPAAARWAAARFRSPSVS